jgi:hypothetical protein
MFSLKKPKLIKSLFLKDSLLIILTLFIIFFYFLNALLFSRNVFSNHIGFLFNEANQLLSGSDPYKEFFILYGIGTPSINAISLFLFGKNFFSIYLMTNIFYFLSIFFILLISLKIKKNIDLIDNLLFITIFINIYPVPNIPWSTYLSYFPIVLSLYFILEKNKISYFFSGLFLAAACLIRETVLLSAIIIFLFIVLECVFREKNINNLKFYILGFCIPLIIFISYMIISSNYLIWKELVYPLNRWQTLINVGYYINSDITPLREFYILVLAPYRELILVFLRSVQYFWFNWLLIFTSYFCCFLILYKRIIKNNYWKEDELIKYRISLVSIYCLSLIIQNLHSVNIDRVAVGSIIGILSLYYFINKIINNKKIRFISYAAVLIMLFFYTNGISSEEDKVDGKLNQLYKISFENIKKNANLFFIKKKEVLEKKNKITEFDNMSYSDSTHKFYNNIKEICNELGIKKGIKYFDNQTDFWELASFCKLKPKYYYFSTMSEFYEKTFQESKHSKKYDSNNNNTISFYVSNNLNINETTYWDLTGLKKKRRIKDFDILYYYDLKKDYQDLFRYYKYQYFFITKKNN